MPEPKYLTQDELKRLFRVIDNPRDKTIFLVAYKHGLRASEIGLLEVGDIDFSRNKIYLRRLKHSMSGEQVLAQDEVKYLRKWLRKRKPRGTCLFPSKQGNPISRKQLDVLMKKYGVEAGISKEKRHFHVLKHSAGVHMLDAGADIMLVRELLGHRNIQNAMVYAQLASARRDELHRNLLRSPRIVSL